MMKQVLLVITLMITVSFTSAAQDKTVYLTSLEWPPYTGQALPEQGASIIIAKAAFMAMGYTLVVDFYPWERAVDQAKNNDKYVGYFPEYYADSIKQDFIFSDPMGEGPLGFAELKSNPIKWGSLKDLKAYTIGVVNGYVNTAEFDDMVAKNQLKTEGVVSDDLNLKKIGTNRLPLAVIDENVMNYLLKTEVGLKEWKDKIQFNKKILENKKLYICFKKGAKGEALSKIFNDGVKKINVNALMKDYFTKALK